MAKIKSASSSLTRYKNLITEAAKKALKKNFLLILYGSFAKGNADRLSDIDIAVYTGRPLSPKEFFNLKYAIENLPILREIELVDLAEVKDVKFLEEVLRGEIWISEPELLKDLKRRLKNLKKS